MSNPTFHTHTLVFSSMLAATMIASGVTAILLRPGKALCTIILHFADGMVFAVVAVEFWPFVRGQSITLAEAAGFVIGIAILLGLRWLTHNAVWKNQQISSTAPLSLNLLIETGENIVIDGLIISVAFAVATRAGVFLTVALAVEAISLGIAAASRTSNSSFETRIAVVFSLGSCYVVASGIGVFTLRHLSDDGVAIALSLSSAALLFLAAEALLVDAREMGRVPARAAAFFAGYLGLLLLDVMSGSS